jgi:hypothetical protein
MANNQTFEQAKIKFKYILTSESLRDYNEMIINRIKSNNVYRDTNIPGLVNLRKKQEKIQDEIINLQYDWVLKESKDDDVLFFYLTYWMFKDNYNIRQFVKPSGHNNRVRLNYNKFELDIESLKQHFKRRVTRNIQYNGFGKTMRLLKNKYSNVRLRSEARSCKNANETRQKAIRIMQNAKVLPY